MALLAFDATWDFVLSHVERRSLVTSAWDRTRARRSSLDFFDVRIHRVGVLARSLFRMFFGMLFRMRF